MAPRTPIPIIKVDPRKQPHEQEQPLHNRWHPDIPSVAQVTEGDLFRVETIDWTGGQIRDDDSAEDVKHVDLSRRSPNPASFLESEATERRLLKTIAYSRFEWTTMDTEFKSLLRMVHYLSGPIRVVDKEGVSAHPGDLLVVEICNLGPLPGDEWGFTGSFDRENGGGFLTDHFPHATKAIWEFDGIFASSRHIPGVRFPGLIHPGLIGTAPSKELLDIWNTRETQLVENGAEAITLGAVLHTRPLANLPLAKGALLGKMQQGTPDFERIAAEAARTIPGRENGGNCDIKNLSRGCKVYFPVFVEGANLSMGDMHFSQGDGEVSFCGAIEMSGFLELKCEILRGGVEQYLTPMGPTKLHVNPIFEIGPLEPRFSEWLVFEGLSVDEQGRQHYLDATVAYKRAVLNAIDYLSKFGYTKEQVYLLLSCCPCEGRLSGIVDAPNACATLAIPVAIFDQDIRPKRGGPPVGPRLIKRGDVARSTYDGILSVTKNLALH